MTPSRWNAFRDKIDSTLEQRFRRIAREKGYIDISNMIIKSDADKKNELITIDIIEPPRRYNSSLSKENLKIQMHLPKLLTHISIYQFPKKLNNYGPIHQKYAKSNRQFGHSIKARQNTRKRYRFTRKQLMKCKSTYKHSNRELLFYERSYDVLHDAINEILIELQAMNNTV